ncbi:MAG TPA: zinc ribbon domain-containing protein, partial [Pyrinomonadaceae bacterium]|nr:zinc ribbon domain-containing protein [Pyrinomonadaceae bacterium]
MYCPSCGQQQISDEMRYCSRCGLALTGLLEWLAGGRLPLTTAEEAQVAPDSRRRKNIRRAGKLMFFAGALFPVFLAFSIGADEPGPLGVPFFLFFVALAWMLYARIFMSKT